jgi:hypothetical protein
MRPAGVPDHACSSGFPLRHTTATSPCIRSLMQDGTTADCAASPTIFDLSRVERVSGMLLPPTRRSPFHAEETAAATMVSAAAGRHMGSIAGAADESAMRRGRSKLACCERGGSGQAAPCGARTSAPCSRARLFASQTGPWLQLRQCVAASNVVPRHQSSNQYRWAVPTPVYIPNLSLVP